MGRGGKSGRVACRLMVVVIGVISNAWAGNPSMVLSIDASEAPRRILHVRESLAVGPGRLTLYSPQWIPGEHGPTGPITDLVGLKLSANGAPVEWRRDLDDMFAFHCTVPAGTTALELSFDFLLSSVKQGFSSAASASAHLLVLSWNQVVLYPKDVRPDSIVVTPGLRLPEGWKFGTALETAQGSPPVVQFAPVSLNMLIDSPVLAGEFFKRIDISAGLPTPHYLDMASDSWMGLEMPDRVRREYEALVREANALFGAHHYNHYDFLYTISNEVASFGLEHHQSSDDRVPEKTLIDKDYRVTTASLLPHEFVHSWNGKYRRPAGLATGNYSSPMQGDLLWVYEGLTQYLGNILCARSGLRTPEEYREHLAMTAAELDNRPGREWRPLQDAADAAQILYGARDEWSSYRRGVDYYDEGDLIWLEVDVLLRELTHGTKSMNDFCRLFHGGSSTGPALKPYTFDDVVASLNAIAPYDWSSLLRERLQSLNAHAPMRGIENGGWHLVYRDTLSAMELAYEERTKQVDLRYSLGVNLSEDGTMLDVIPGSPAAAAGLAPGMKLIAVDGKAFTKELVRFAIRGAAHAPQPIDLLAQNGDSFKTYTVNYHGGERYPFLERLPGKADILSGVIAPIAGSRTE